MIHVAAIILAGGSGLRMGNSLPKQFLKLGDRPILMHTISKFAEAIENCRIIVVLPENHTEYWKDLCNEYGFKIPPARAFGVFVNGESVSANEGGTLNGFIEAAPNDFKYHVYSRKNRGGEEITLTATGQRVDRSSLGDLGGLWAMYGVYYWSCNANSAGMAYSMCIRKDSETNIYTIGFMGSQTMARPVRCIKE